jgi:hypothetical protein
MPSRGAQPAVPAQDRVRREDGADLSKSLSAESLALDRKALGVVEPDRLLTVRFLQDLVLGPQILDDRLLLAVDPSSQGGQEKMPGL